MDSFPQEIHHELRVAVVVGSLRRDSFNRQLAGALAKLVAKDLEFVQARIDDLPLYNQDDDQNQAEPVRRLKSEIAGAQAVLFVTPRVQPLHSGRAEERDRQRVAPLWPERLGPASRRA
jgi:hypothetical protein